jgi:hypothetical protein
MVLSWEAPGLPLGEEHKNLKPVSPFFPATAPPGEIGALFALTIPHRRKDIPALSLLKKQPAQALW